MHLCSCDRTRVHKEILRHELLHVLLLQHGITGHPREFARGVAGWTDWGTEGLAASPDSETHRDSARTRNAGPLSNTPPQARPSRVD